MTFIVASSDLAINSFPIVGKEVITRYQNAYLQFMCDFEPVFEDHILFDNIVQFCAYIVTVFSIRGGCKNEDTTTFTSRLSLNRSHSNQTWREADEVEAVIMKPAQGELTLLVLRERKRDMQEILNIEVLLVNSPHEGAKRVINREQKVLEERQIEIRRIIAGPYRLELATQLVKHHVKATSRSPGHLHIAPSHISLTTSLTS